MFITLVFCSSGMANCGAVHLDECSKELHNRQGQRVNRQE